MSWIVRLARTRHWVKPAVFQPEDAMTKRDLSLAAIFRQARDPCASLGDRKNHFKCTKLKTIGGAK